MSDRGEAEHTTARSKDNVGSHGVESQIVGLGDGWGDGRGWGTVGRMVGGTVSLVTRQMPG